MCSLVVTLIVRNYIKPHLPSHQSLVQLLKTHDLNDIWRQLNGEYDNIHVVFIIISLARLDRIYVLVLSITAVFIRVVLLLHRGAPAIELLQRSPHSPTHKG